MIIIKISLSSSKQAPPPRIEHNAADTWLQSGLKSLSLPSDWGGGNPWLHLLGLSVDKWTQGVAVVWDWEGYVCWCGAQRAVHMALIWSHAGEHRHFCSPLGSILNAITSVNGLSHPPPGSQTQSLAVAGGRSAHVMEKGSHAPRLASKAFWHASHQDMWMVPYVRLQTHFMVEKPCFPCIPESGEPRAAERIAALCQSWQSSIPTWSMNSLLSFFKSSHQDCPYLLYSIIQIASLIWRNHKVEILKTYSSGLLLKRDSGTYCATLMSPPCPVFCNVWVLTTSPAICAGSLCLLGFCSESSTAIAHCPKTQSLSVMWFTFPPFSF